MTAHAKLSPSSAYRWFVCPGSVAASAGLPDDSNEYAREGTAAHTLCERCLKTGTDASKWIGTHEGRIRVSYTDHEGNPADQFFLVDHAMAEAVQVYLDYVREIGSAQGARVLVEQKVRLGPIDSVLEPVWGTADCIVYVSSTKTLYVIDYKHGAGKVVDVHNNLQLKIYALAAWATFNKQFDVEHVVAAIVQPRAGFEPVRSVPYAAVDLLDFAQDVVEAVERTQASDAELIPGPHCDWCKRKPTCRALVAKAVDEAQDEFQAKGLQAPQFMGIDECVAVLEKAELLEDWIKGVRQYLHEMAERGAHVPGYKLVPRRGQRQWAKPESEVIATLAPLVARDEEMYRKELLSPAQMEKVVGKKNMPGTLTVTVSSGYNLVKDTDARPAITLHPGDDFMALPNPENPL